MPLTRSAAKRAQEASVIEAVLHSTLHRQHTLVTVSTSATGQGTHTRWLRSSSAEASELKHSLALSPTSSLSSIDSRFITPAPRDSFDAGSVIRTPVKKLAPHPDRIGPDRIDFWHDKGSGFKAFITDSGKAAVAHGHVANFQLQQSMTSREECNESPRGVRLEREENTSPFGLGPEGTILNVNALASPFQSQANLVVNNRRFGPEGTELLEVDNREDIVDESVLVRPSECLQFDGEHGSSPSVIELSC